MRRFALALIVVSLGLFPLACSGDDDPPTGLPTGDPDLAAMVGCLSEGLVHVGLALETGLILYHELDPGETLPFTPPPEFSYNSDTGAFEHSWTISSQTTEIYGEVDPVTVVQDGLQQGDIFTVGFEMMPVGSLDAVAGGGLRVNHLGLTLPPNQTETMRIIPAWDLWVYTGGTCQVTVNQLDIIVHHLVTNDELQTMSMGFVAVNDTQVLEGYLTASGDADIANISAQFKGENYACDLDLDTYALDCYPV